MRAILLTALDVASAMAALHTSGTIHGALTSNNVLLTSDSSEKYRGWQAKVGDYALVASESALSSGSEYKAGGGYGGYGAGGRSSGKSTVTYHGSKNNGHHYPGVHPGTGNLEEQQNEQQEHPLLKFRGTTVRAMNRPPCAAHVPPDVLLGAPLTPASDVYSFGVLLWELVCARRAWRTLKPREVVHAVAVQGCRLPTEIKGAPPPVVELMQLCLAEDATSRPSFEHVVETLKQIQVSMV
jgi:serine/threonine protein kinase